MNSIALFFSFCAVLHQVISTVEAVDGTQNLRIRNLNLVPTTPTISPTTNTMIQQPISSPTTTTKTFKVCSSVAPGVYETMVVVSNVPPIDTVRGNCRNKTICERVCTSHSYNTYQVTKTQCKCSLLRQQPTTTTTTAPIKPDNVVVAIVPITAPTIAPTTAPTIAPTTAPTIAPTTAPTIAPTTAPTIAPTTTTTTIKTIFCHNPYGNPCGPGSACTDTVTGISCRTYNVYNDCAPWGGCSNDPNSSCIRQVPSTVVGYQCICNAGFSRSHPNQSCTVHP